MDSSAQCRRSGRLHLFLLSLYLLFLDLSQLSFAQPVTLPFTSCAPSTVTESNPLRRVNVTAVYGQLHHADQPDMALRLTIIGAVGDTLEGYSNTTGYLATLFTSTDQLTYSVFDNTTALCDNLRPPSPLPELTSDAKNYCPLSAGSLAVGIKVPLSQQYPLKTLVTQIRMVDDSSPAHELVCLQVSTTSAYSGNQLTGPLASIWWTTIGLTLAYWIVTGIGRISAAWDRGVGRTGNVWWLKIERTGFILASALSGEKFSVSPALLRFATPSARDLLLTTQWCASLGMIAAQWPDSTYPIISNTAWSTLLYNVSLTTGNGDNGRWSPLTSTGFEPPSEFAQQISDPQSPLFLDPAEPNQLFTYPPGSRNGLAKFTSSLGVLPQHVFGISLSIFLIITACVIGLHGLVALIGWTGQAVLGKTKKAQSERKDLNENDGRRTPFKRRFSLNSFHTSTTHGNLVRLLILFHFPITIYSCYHLTLDHSVVSAGSKALAGLAFALFSLILPSWLIFRISTTNTSRLYEATRTLLSLGPLYNQYQPRSQLFCCLYFGVNLTIGMIIGFGQNNGTVQAVLILVVEVLSTLATSVWLPWMNGAQMGVISFMFCVARIIATVLVVILAPAINIGPQAGGWIAFGILAIMGVMYLAFALMLVIKILEGFIRIVRGLSFASSKHSLDSGLFGALGCFGASVRRHKRRRRRTADGQTVRSHKYSESSRATSPPMGLVAGVAGNSVSYLRPEQASVPYREDSDDDAGFIMESWSKTDLTSGMSGKSNLKLEEAATSTEDSTPSTGFTRVGGGRAHFATPYAIMKGKGPLAPGRSEENPAPLSQFSHQGFQMTPKSSSSSPSLPKGAARPIHARTRSQTAVIEDASHLMGGAAVGNAVISASRPGSAGRPPSSGKNSRPSTGRSLQGGRPGSAGRKSVSRPPSSSGVVPRAPSRGDTHGRPGLVPPDEMGILPSGYGPPPPTSSHSQSATTSRSKGKGWFGLGANTGGDSSSDDDDDEEKSKASSGKRGGRWGFKKRRKSESDMAELPLPTQTQLPGQGVSSDNENTGELNRSFVVIRNRPPNLGPLPAPMIDPSESGHSHQSHHSQPHSHHSHQSHHTHSQSHHSHHGMDVFGSPLEEPGLLAPTALVLVNKTPEAKDESRTLAPPPSSYVPPRYTRG